MLGKVAGQVKALSEEGDAAHKRWKLNILSQIVSDVTERSVGAVIIGMRWHKQLRIGFSALPIVGQIHGRGRHLNPFKKSNKKF